MVEELGGGDTHSRTSGVTDHLADNDEHALALARAGEFVTVEDAVVQRADIGATNGVAHVIDRVLMPAKK
mgnify:CR=1 FL=1